MTRRLQVVIEKCCTELNEGKEISMGDLVKIADIIEQFVDRFHHFKEESAYFPATEGKDHYSEDVRKFLIEHEFGRRIAKRIRLHLEESKTQSNFNEPLVRYLRTYSVFIQDHTSKEDKFFGDVQTHHSLSHREEQALAEKFDSLKEEWRKNNSDMYGNLERLENTDWGKVA